MLPNLLSLQILLVYCTGVIFFFREFLHTALPNLCTSLWQLFNIRNPSITPDTLILFIICSYENCTGSFLQETGSLSLLYWWINLISSMVRPPCTLLRSMLLSPSCQQVILFASFAVSLHSFTDIPLFQGTHLFLLNLGCGPLKRSSYATIDN